MFLNEWLSYHRVEKLTEDASAQSQGRKKMWPVAVFCLTCTLFKKFLNQHVLKKVNCT